MKRLALAIGLCCLTLPAWVICVAGMITGDPVQAVAGAAVTIVCWLAIWYLP
jgi:maltodextrin utilization protein YvdJ